MLKRLLLTVENVRDAQKAISQEYKYPPECALKITEVAALVEISESLKRLSVRNFEGGSRNWED